MSNKTELASADDLKCSFAHDPFTRCGKPAVNEIVYRKDQTRAGLRCAQHTANLSNSDVFGVRPLEKLSSGENT